ncbi:uncharacterized protein [Branchiostoma lanceolatum]|uniref:uncharacterized protein n=1 Tax=Branchiostoma lanceolatum TaxID=7740 RepID=UPI003455FBAF
MAARWMWVCLVTLTFIELGSSDPRFTFVQDRLSKKEQEAVFDLFKKHWRPGVSDAAFEEYLTRIVYSPTILKENLPARIVELLRALDNMERLELVREVRELMDFREEQNPNIGRGLKEQGEKGEDNVNTKKTKKGDTDKKEMHIKGPGLKEEDEKIKNEQKLVAALKAKKKEKKEKKKQEG